MYYGSIRLSTNPSGANVFVRGENKGITPIDIINVYPDTYNVRLDYPDLRIYNFNTTVKDGMMTDIFFDFINQEVSEEYVNLNGSSLVIIPEEKIITPENGEVSVPSIPNTTSENIILTQHLADMNTILDKNNSLISDVRDILKLSSHRVKDQQWYDAENLITVAVIVKPDDNNSVLYQYESIHDVLGRNSGELDIINEGPGILYIVTSVDGIHYKDEVTLFEGQKKSYDDLYSVGLRSSTANLVYKVTERKVTTVSGQQFSGSRFKERRDRSGVILFQDDYESPTLKFSSLIVNIVTNLPSAGSIARSIDTSYSGDFSIKTVTGPNPNDGVIMFYNHPDFHVGNVASQFHFASDADVYIAQATIDFFSGTNRNRGLIFFVAGSTFNVGDLFLLNANGSFSTIATGIPTFASIRSWNILKLVIDVGALEYVSAVVNGNRINLTGTPLQIISNTTARQVLSQIVTFSPSIGGAKTVFFDNYIFTEDESLQ